MIMVPGERIKEITSEGLVYVNDEGEETSIDFALCFQNWIEARLAPEALEKYKEVNHMTDEQVQEHVTKWQKDKIVGYRNVIGSPNFDHPYITFHTKPPTHFEFSTVEALYQVQNALRQARWRTIDLS